MNEFNRVSFTEAQLYALDSIEKASYTQGMWMGVLYSIGGVVGMSVAIYLTGEYGHLIYQYL